MKCAMLVVSAVLLTLPVASLAADYGGDIYKKKCAGCHGASGEGKPSVKAPALKGTQLEASQIVDPKVPALPSGCLAKAACSCGTNRTADLSTNAAITTVNARIAPATRSSG